MKKFLIIFLILFVSGCNGGHGNLESSGDSETSTSASKIWTSNTGTATIASINELEAYTKLFGELPDEITAEYKQEEDITAPITRAVAYVDTENNLFTGVIIISNDEIFQPIIYNNVPLTKQGEDFITPDGTKISNTTISGSYFSTTMTRKTHDTSIKLEDVLSGTWTLDGSQCGGASDDIVITPEKVSMFFSTDNKVNIFYSLRDNASALYQDAFSTEGSLRKIDDDVYKFIETDGTESLILVENIDEIFMFRNNVFLPLKKVSFTPAKSWKAVSGGGYINVKMESDDEIENMILSLIDTVSFTLKSGSLTISEDNTADFDYSFAVHNELFEKFGINDFTDSSKMTFTPSGNFLQYTDDSESEQIVFISETEAFFTMTANEEGVGEGKFIIKFKAEE